MPQDGEEAGDCRDRSWPTWGGHCKSHAILTMSSMQSVLSHAAHKGCSGQLCHTTIAAHCASPLQVLAHPPLGMSDNFNGVSMFANYEWECTKGRNSTALPDDSVCRGQATVCAKPGLERMAVPFSLAPAWVLIMPLCVLPIMCWCVPRVDGVLERL